MATTCGASRRPLAARNGGGARARYVERRTTIGGRPAAAGRQQPRLPRARDRCRADSSSSAFGARDAWRARRTRPKVEYAVQVVATSHARPAQPSRPGAAAEPSRGAEARRLARPSATSARGRAIFGSISNASCVAIDDPNATSKFRPVDPNWDINKVITDMQLEEFAQVHVTRPGAINADELRALMESVGQAPTEQELANMIAAADVDVSATSTSPSSARSWRTR